MTMADTFNHTLFSVCDPTRVLPRSPNHEDLNRAGFAGGYAWHDEVPHRVPDLEVIA